MRRAWISGAFGAAMLSFGGVIAGCIIFTGGTSGYTLEDAGSSALVLDAATCPCSSGEICCLGSGQAGLGYSCVEAGFCELGSIQICKSTSDCENASCVTQECQLPPVVVRLSSCGVLPGCTVYLDAGPGGAGPVNSGSGG